MNWRLDLTIWKRTTAMLLLQRKYLGTRKGTRSGSQSKDRKPKWTICLDHSIAIKSTRHIKASLASTIETSHLKLNQRKSKMMATNFTKSDRNKHRLAFLLESETLETWRTVIFVKFRCTYAKSLDHQLVLERMKSQAVSKSVNGPITAYKTQLGREFVQALSI